jgi:hypothetical protein
MKSYALALTLLLALTGLTTGCAPTREDAAAPSSRPARDPAGLVTALASPVPEALGRCIGRQPCCEHSDTNPNRCTVFAVCFAGNWVCP